MEYLNHENRVEVLNKYVEQLRSQMYLYIIKDISFLEGKKSYEQIENEKLANLQNKIDHTMRTIEGICNIASSMGVELDLQRVFKTAALLHDYGRFEQAMLMDSFVDLNFSKMGYKFQDENRNWKTVQNHAQFGYDLLHNKGHIDKFKIQNQDIIPVEITSLYHGAVGVPDYLNYNFQNLFDKKSVNDLISNPSKINAGEQAVINLVLRTMQDADRIDILNMYVTGDIPLRFKTLFYYHTEQSLEFIADRFGMDISDILDINDLKNGEDITSLKYIIIPLDKVTNMESLVVPKDFKEKFFSEDSFPLSNYNKSIDRSFITEIWWRITEFINNMNFSSSLDVIYSTKLLDKIDDKIPSKYKYLFIELFDFAKEKLQEYSENKDTIIDLSAIKNSKS